MNVIDEYEIDTATYMYIFSVYTYIYVYTEMLGWDMYLTQLIIAFDTKP